MLASGIYLPAILASLLFCEHTATLTSHLSNSLMSASVNTEWPKKNTVFMITFDLFSYCNSLVKGKAFYCKLRLTQIQMKTYKCLKNSSLFTLKYAALSICGGLRGKQFSLCCICENTITQSLGNPACHVAFTLVRGNVCSLPSPLPVIDTPCQ